MKLPKPGTLYYKNGWFVEVHCYHQGNVHFVKYFVGFSMGYYMQISKFVEEILTAEVVA